MRSGSPVRASEFYPFPSELWDLVLDCVPRSQLQSTALSLSRTLPQSHVSVSHLCRHVNIRKTKQLKALVVRLQQSDAAALKDGLRSISFSDWMLDENVVAILLNRLASSGLKELLVCLGPRWTPEALQEGFATPMPSLEHLAFRFNLSSLVKNYDSFHKGQYFDTTLQTLAQWPSGRLVSFSFVQDPPPDLSAITENDPDKMFAQPIVLHRTFCITAFVASPLAQGLQYLRFRIPNRSVTTALSSDATSSVVLPGPSIRILHNLSLLDISTTFLQLGPAFKAFLARHHRLHHLIIDRCGLLSFPFDAATLGKMVSGVGLTRAAEAHKAWRALFQRKSEAISAHHRRNGPTGRTSASSRRRLEDNFASMSISTSDRISEYDNVPSKVIILPPSSTFRSICCGTDLIQDEDEREEWDEAFQRGYHEGLAAMRESLDDKTGQLRRAEAKRELRPDGDGCFLRFLSLEEEKECRQHHYKWSSKPEPFQTLCQTFGLVPATRDDLQALLMQVAESACTFCSVPDCAAYGGVAVSLRPLSSVLRKKLIACSTMQSGVNTMTRLIGSLLQHLTISQTAAT